MEDFRRDVTDTMTFGQMKTRDIDNVSLVMKACKEHVFDTVPAAMKWTNDAMQGIMLKFGIDKDRIIMEALSLPLDHFLVRQMQKEAKGMGRQVEKIDPRRLLAAKRLDVKQKDADVHIEQRKYTNQNDLWRSGIYVYHHNEIAYYMSAPYRRKGGHYQTPHIIVPAFGKWFILSNWKDDVKIAS